MPMRFLIETNQGTVSVGTQLSLDAERSHYLCKVMRVKSGDELACFDGNGTSFTARLLQVKAKKCTLVVSHVDNLSTRSSPRMHLGLSLLKGQAMDRALHQATELGASEITLLAARRSNVHLDAQRMSKKILHWRRVLAAACEQSGHLFVPVLNEPCDLNELLACATEAPLAFDVHGEPLPETIVSQDYLLLIGPEGGWDEVERGLFKQHKLFCYRLGDHTLRAETAPAVALTLIRHLQKS